jgi:hypothetical protein
MTNLLEIGSKHKIKKLEKAVTEITDILKAISTAKKALQVYKDYRSLKFILLDLDEAHRMYFGLYKKARDKLKEVKGEMEHGEDN